MLKITSFYRTLLMQRFDTGDSTSRARVHVDHGIITASIATKDDIYIVEVQTVIFMSANFIAFDINEDG